MTETVMATGFLDDGPDEGADIGVGWSVFVKRTIRADPMAKGDVDVEDQESRGKI